MLPTTREYDSCFILASNVAKDTNCSQVSSDHLLIGLLAQIDCTAARVLRSFDLNSDSVQTELKKLVEPEEQLPLGPFSKRTFEIINASHDVARGLRSEFTSTKHLLIAIIDDALENENTSRFGLLMRGITIDLSAVRQKSFGEADREFPQTGGCFIIADSSAAVKNDSIEAKKEESKGKGFKQRKLWIFTSLLVGFIFLLFYGCSKLLGDLEFPKHK